MDFTYFGFDKIGEIIFGSGDLTRSVEADGFFDAIVPAADLLGL